MKRVAFQPDMLLEFMQDRIEGFLTYAHQQGDWEIYTENLIPAISEDRLPLWDGDGIIVSTCTIEQEALLRSKGIAIVGVYVGTSPRSFPVVCSDNEEIGRTAARHLCDLGLSRFAFIGDAHQRYSQGRFQGFASELTYAGYTCASHLGDYAQSPSLDEARAADVVSFLQSFEKPLGIMVSNDRLALGILPHLRRAGIRVPDDIAVVGVDNLELLCRTSLPPLSSVAHNGQQIGYLAAELLDKCMRGEAVAPDIHAIAPLGVVQRQSSDPRDIHDSRVESALAYIRNRLGHPIDATDVANVAKVSRKTLDMRFQKEVGRTVAKEIRRMRIEQAKLLMRQEGLSLTDIALRCGYRNLQRFYEAFRAETGMPPRAFNDATTR
jgi:LacI family transcriptional regulator